MMAGMASLPRTFSNFAAAAQAGGKPMNVLFVAVDDLKPELPCYGAKHIIAPNIDRLAASGTVFQRAYCQQAICAPSRASILTGCRPDTTGVHGLQTPLPTSAPHLMTIPRHFRQNGYHTVGFGKIYHHGPAKEDPQGFDETPTLKFQAKGRGYVLPENLPEERTAKGLPTAPVERADVPDEAYVDGAAAAEGIRQLQQMKDQPFFMAMGIAKPHLPFSAPLSTGTCTTAASCNCHVSGQRPRARTRS